VAAVLQDSLFDRTDRVDTASLTNRVRRIDLGQGAWLDLAPTFVTGADLLMRELLTDVAWRGERRPMYDRVVDVPRLVAFFAADAPLPHPALARIRDELSAYYQAELGEPFVTAGLCQYRDGRDSVAWHGDRIGRSSTEDTVVAIVSLGTPRQFAMRPRRGGAALRFEPAHGDLLVMGGSCQRTWEHAIPKSARTIGTRVSIQFRPHNVR
jgi:alkylated DNA repair dioxygenase AlkB